MALFIHQSQILSILNKCIFGFSPNFWRASHFQVPFFLKVLIPSTLCWNKMLAWNLMSLGILSRADSNVRTQKTSCLIANVFQWKTYVKWKSHFCVWLDSLFKSRIQNQIWDLFMFLHRKRKALCTCSSAYALLLCIRASSFFREGFLQEDKISKKKVKG